MLETYSIIDHIRPILLIGLVLFQIYLKPFAEIVDADNSSNRRKQDERDRHGRKDGENRQ